MLKGKVLLGYLAGIIDGEGSIMIVRRPSKPTHSPMMRVVVSNTNKTLLQLFQLNFGGNISAAKRYNKPYCKTCFQWTSSSQKALACLKIIEPYLFIKRAQAQIAIEFQKSRGKGGKPLTDEQRAVDEAKVLLIQNLNKKGVH